MTDEYSEYIYTQKDIEIAFDKGLQTGLTIFESSLCLSYDGQKLLLEKMKNGLMEEDSSVMAKHHQSKVVHFHSHRKNDERQLEFRCNDN